MFAVLWVGGGSLVLYQLDSPPSEKGSPKTWFRKGIEQHRKIYAPDPSQAPCSVPVHCPHAHRCTHKCTAPARPHRHTRLTKHGAWHNSRGSTHAR